LHNKNNRVGPRNTIKFFEDALNPDAGVLNGPEEETNWCKKKHVGLSCIWSEEDPPAWEEEARATDLVEHSKAYLLA
jgi:hypothetical protein